MTEGLFYAVLRITDVLQLLKLTVKETLNLRLVTKTADEIIVHSERFWKRAFPGIEAFERFDTYAECVIERCRSLYLLRKMEKCQASAAYYARQKSGAKQKVERRRQKIIALQKEMHVYELDLSRFERHQEFESNQVKALKAELKERGYKRNKLKNIESEVAFKKQRWKLE